jgi:hypothetical protein
LVTIVAFLVSETVFNVQYNPTKFGSIIPWSQERAYRLLSRSLPLLYSMNSVSLLALCPRLSSKLSKVSNDHVQAKDKVSFHAVVSRNTYNKKMSTSTSSTTVKAKSLLSTLLSPGLGIKTTQGTPHPVLDPYQPLPNSASHWQISLCTSPKVNYPSSAVV